MNSENEKKLFSSFPKLYKYIPYFECGDGWFNLIWNLSEKLVAIIQETKLDLEEFDENSSPEDIYFADQVKEKFGYLNFYMSNSSSEIRNVIDSFENESKLICEDCGKSGKMRKGGWIRTLCDECSD